MSNDGRRFEGLIDALYNSMNTRIDRIQEYFRNETPPGKRPMPDTEQLQQFMQVRDNPEAWSQLIAAKGVKNAVKYNEYGERLVHKFQTKALNDLGMADHFPEFEPRKVNPALVQALTAQVDQIQQQLQMNQQPQQQPMQPPAPEQPPMQQAPMPPEQGMV